MEAKYKIGNLIQVLTPIEKTLVTAKIVDIKWFPDGSHSAWDYLCLPIQSEVDLCGEYSCKSSDCRGSGWYLESEIKGE